METKLFKRVLSLAIVVFMVVSMLPTQVWAENVDMDVEDFYDPSASSDPYYCPTCKMVGDWEDVAEGAWNAGGDILGDGKHYRLTGDQNIAAALIVAADTTVCIDLNGHNITAPKTNGIRAFAVSGVLTISDSAEVDGTISGGQIRASGGASSAHVYQYGGNILVSGADAALHLYGGTISGGKTAVATYMDHANGGNIGLTDGATFNMYGGTVTEGYVAANQQWSKTTNGGGNIYAKNSNVNIYGGTVSEGEVYAVYSSGTGSSGRDTRGLGGNIAVDGGAFFMDDGTVTGGLITGSTTATHATNTKATATCYAYGGNIYCYQADVKICGGTISDGSATAKASAKMTSAKAYAYGGNLYISGCTFTMLGGTVSGGSVSNAMPSVPVASTCEVMGGNIYFNETTATIRNAQISGGAANSKIATTAAAATVNARGGNIYTVAGSLALTKVTVSDGAVTAEAHTSSGAVTGNAYGGNLFTNNTAVEFTAGTISGGIATLTGVSSDSGAATGTGKGGNLFAYSDATTPAAFHIGGTAVISGGKASAGTVTGTSTTRETHGGNICSGGVNLVIDGDARVENGLVVQNITNSRGGNIYVTSKTVTLSGNAVVTGGQSGEEASDAARGGNVFVGGSGTFNMRGGSVTGGKAGWGVNVMLMANAKMNMYDGIISGGTGENYGILNQRGILKIYGGTVKMSDDGYSAVSVQGTAATNGGTAYIYGGEIEKLYITYASTLDVYGGEINAYAPASNFTGTTRIYAAKLGFDPGADAVSCANVVGGGDAYIVWHNAGTCATCGHTFGDICATCSIAHGISDCYHIYENGACKFCGIALAAHTATCAHGCENVTWLPFDGLAVADGGHYYLTDDMVLMNQLNISGISVCIDLNGYTVTGPEAKRCFYISGAAGALHLMDSSAHNTGTLKGAGVAFNGNGGMVYVGTDSAFYLYDATVTGGITTADRGANLYTTNGLIVIDNGKVTNGINRDGDACRGGNICLYDPNALLIMKGSDAKITGGMVDGPHAYGGNIYCGSGADIVIYDGEISGGYATRDGANIELMNGSGATTRGLHYMYGGTIGDVHPDTPSDVGNFVVYGSSYINDFYVFGGHIQSMDDNGTNNEVKIYGGTFGFDPRTSDDNVASNLGQCACVTYDEATGIYTVVHTAGTGTCDICAAHDNGPEEYTVTYANTGSHSLVEGSVVAPNCTEQGYTNYTCSVCGGSQKGSFTDPDGVTHTYDDNGDCVRCDASVVAKVTDTEGNETWYATFTEALAFANGKGYTVKALKNVSENLQPVYGTSSAPIRNVTIDANPGVTITDTTYTSGTANYNLYLRGVTLTQNANLIVKCGLSVVTGESTINGSTQSYTLSVADGAVLNINGTVTNDGNAMINGTVKVNEGGVWNANNNSNPNFIGLYNGAIEVNGGTINCDNFKPTHSGTGTVSVTLNNATLNAREAICVKNLALTMEGTNNVTLCGEAFDLSGITTETKMGWVSNSKSFIEAAGYDIDLTLVKNITIASSGVTINYPATVNLNGHTLSGPIKLAEGGSVTLVGENTGNLTVTTALEGKCVWQSAGVYTTGDHVYTYDPVTGEGTCSNGCGATATCAHRYSAYTSNGDATCTEDGTKSATCSVCGHVDTVTDEGSHLGHAYGNWIDNGENHKKVCANGCGIDLFEDHNHDADVTEPDCVNGGYTTHTCVCGNTYTDTPTDATGHAYGNWIDNGENHKKVCANGCGIDLFEDHNHEADVTEPDCENGGYTTHTCVCGNTYTDNSVDALGHAYGNWIDNGENHKKVCANGCGIDLFEDHDHDAVVTEPDCVNGGYTTHTCVCGNTYTDTPTDATGHAYGNWIDNGENHKKVCANGCGIDLFEEHDHDAVVTEPDCENGGYTTHTCVCGNTYTDTPTDATGHAYGNWIDNGENHKKVCANGCGIDLFEEHDHDADVTEPDCVNGGYTTHTCICGNTYTDTPTDATGHAYGNWIDNGENHKKVCANGCGIDLFEDHNHDAVVTEPDCENGGYTTHTCICGNTYTDTPTDATGHAYGNWIDNGENHKKVCANGCGIDLFEDHNHDADVTEPDCENGGYTTHTCVCGNTYTDSYVSETGHAYGNWIDNGENHKKVCANGCGIDLFEDHNHDADVTEPDCVNGGYTTHTCVCGNTYTDTPTDATGHAYGNWIDNGENHKKVCANGCGIDLFEEHDHDAVVTAPNCSEQGFTTNTCECGNTYVDNYTDPDGVTHDYDAFGDCTRCDASVIAKVTYTDGTVAYYATFLEALVAANGTGATVKALKNVEEVMQPTFSTEDTPLYNVVLDSNPGVTITDLTSLSMEERPDHIFAIKKVTFTENVNFSVSMILNFRTGESVINGTVNTYILSFHGATLVLNGTLNNTGNAMLTTGHVIVNEGGTWNANTNPDITNFLGAYGGILEVNGGTVNCDNFKAVGRNPDENEEGTANRDATVIIRNGTVNAQYAFAARKLHLTLEGENTIIVCERPFDTTGITYETANGWVSNRKSFDETDVYGVDITLMGDITLAEKLFDRAITIDQNGYTLKGTAVVAEGASVTLVGEKNEKLNFVAAQEGWCVWPTDNGDGTTTYAPAEHQFGDWAEGIKKCSNCGEALGCNHNYESVVTEATCESDGYTTHTCTICNNSYTDSVVTALGHAYGAYTINEDGTHTRICGNDETHVETQTHAYETVVTAPNCVNGGYTTYTCVCTHSYVDNYTDPDGVTHDYDEFGDCTRCDASVIAKVTYKDGTVAYYATFLEALVAANGTGATVKALKNVEEVMQPTFGAEEAPLNNVIIDSNPGVTITDTTPLTFEECADHNFYVKKVTFTENADFSVRMILRFQTGSSVVDGRVSTYILGVSGANLTVNGELNNTGNVVFSSGHVTINEGAVWNANTNSNHNFIGIYGGTLEINGGTVNCDMFKTVGRNPDDKDDGGETELRQERDATVIIRDGTLNAREAILVRKTNLTLEGENTVTLAGEAYDLSTITYETTHGWITTRQSFKEANIYDLDMTLMANVTLVASQELKISRDLTVNMNGYKLAGPLELVEGGSLTLVGENTGKLNVTTTLEGKCVWVTTGEGTTTYTTAEHVFGEWDEGVKYCENPNCDAQILCEHTYEDVVTAPTCENAGYTTHTCSICHYSYTDTPVDALGHAWGAWVDNGDAGHSRACGNDATHIETVPHTHDFVVTAPNCSEQGFTTYTCECGNTYVDNYTNPDGVTHDYDEFGDCTRCDASVIAKVTYTDGTVEYYTTFLEALVAAQNTGATVKALKNVAEVMQPTFSTDKTALRNVIIDCNPGVTITDTTPLAGDERPDHTFYLREVTFTEAADFSVNMILHFVGKNEVSAINGNVTTYILFVGDADVQVNGTLNNTGNFVMNSGSITVNEGGVWNANTNTKNANFIGVYGGTLNINGGTVNCDNFKAVGSATADATVIIKDGTLNARDAFCARKLNLTLEGENTITVAGHEFDASVITYETVNGWVSNTASFEEADKYDLNFTLMNSFSIAETVFDRAVTIDQNGYTLTGSVKLAEGGVVTLIGEKAEDLTITTDLEGKCVWVTTDGDTAVYVTAEHVYGPWTEGKQYCTNCGAMAECTHNYESAVTDPTCEAGGFTTHTCTVCGSSYTDTPTGATGHAYGNWVDNGENHKKVCANGCGVDLFENHNHKAEVTEPTCEADGFTTHTCDCGNTYTDTPVDALGHAWGAWADNGDAGHSRVCTNDASHTETAPHAHKSVVTAPTCEADGYTTYTCECGNTYVANQTTALGHEYDSVYTAPTATTNGYTTYTCKNGCGHSYVVEEENSMLHCAQNEQTGVTYDDLQVALNDALKGQSVKLLKDVTADVIYVGAGKTLNLAGCKLTVTESITAPFRSTAIIDTSAAEGLLVLENDADFALNNRNSYLPVKVAEGWKFVSVEFEQALDFKDRTGKENPDVGYYRFAFAEDQLLLDQILANGTTDTGITIRIKVTYVTSAGLNAYQYFDYTDELVKQYYNYSSGWQNAAFRMYLSGVENLAELRFCAEIVSVIPNGSVVIGSTPISD